MNPRPPATSARLCRRALASALSVPLGHNRLSPFAPGVAAIVRPMACTQSPSPWPEPKLVRLEERRSSTSARYFRSASTTVESSNPAGSGANAFKTLSGRAGMLSSCPIGSTALVCVVFSYALPSSLPAALTRPFPTSRRRAGSTESGAGADGASPSVPSGIPTTFARAPAA